MEAVQELQPSFLTRPLRWLADFERVMESRPYDQLEFAKASCRKEGDKTCSP